MEKSKNSDKQSVEFLLKEFERIDRRHFRLKDEAQKRMTFFLSLTSAFLGGLILFNNLIVIEVVGIAVLVFLSFIGWQTFYFLVARDIGIDRLNRSEARIRRYFLDRDQTLKNTLMWPYHDEPTYYLTNNRSAMRRTIELVLSFLWAIAVGILIQMVLIYFGIFGPANVIILVVGILLIIVISYIFLERYSSRKYKNAEQQAKKEVIYPRDKPQEESDRK